jgi:hypothetical protein
MVKCEICEREFTKFGIKGHVWRSHGEGISHKPRLGGEAWNKGLSKESDERVMSYSLSAINNHKCTGKGKTPEAESIRKKKLSDAAKRNNFGGHTSKRKLYHVKKDGSVVFLQSSYEIRLAEILDDLNIEWTRPEPLVWIDSSGESHRYYPDFLIGEIFVDTKNDYLVVKDEEKIRRVIEQNQVDLRIFTLDMITKESARCLIS